MRGDVYWLKPPHDAKGHEQKGSRYVAVVQADVMLLSTWLVAPTSTSARPASFRPEIEIDGQATRVLVEQTRAVDPQRLGDFAGRLALHEMSEINDALRTVLDL